MNMFSERRLINATRGYRPGLSYTDQNKNTSGKVVANDPTSTRPDQVPGVQSPSYSDVGIYAYNGEGGLTDSQGNFFAEGTQGFRELQASQANRLPAYTVPDNRRPAGAPLFGGTTSTGALQSGTVGTANQVMTSNGAGALPTFQDIKSFVEPVFSSTTSSTPLSNPTSATAFGTHTYTIPANDLINGVRYDFEFAAFAVHGVNSTFRLGVGLGASQDISVLFPTTTSADEYCMVRGSIIGEAAAGASANVHIRLTGFTDESDTTTPTRYADVSKATNGTLAITFFGTFGTSDGGNAVTGLDSFITRRSTTAA